MKNISILSCLCAGMLAFTACEKDMDSNPTLQEPTEFVLNVPAYAGNTYDLETSKTLQLTCSQANYGYTAPAVYSVEVSLSEDFAKSAVLDTKYTTAKMDVDAQEIAVAMTNLLLEDGKVETDFPVTDALYMRVSSSLTYASGTIEGSEITSNAVELPSVRTIFALPAVTLPEKLFIIGGFNGWDWGTSPEMVPVNGAEGVFWRMVYLTQEGFKFNTATAWDGNDVGFAGITPVDNVGVGMSDSGGNIAPGADGWYLVVIKSAVNGRNVEYTLELNKPEVWLIGESIGGWDEKMDGALFTAPTTADGFFESPAFIAAVAEDGGTRCYVKVEGYDWWKTEFMLFDGKIKYRGNGGDQDRVNGAVGQKLYLNFMTDTGKME